MLVEERIGGALPAVAVAQAVLDRLSPGAGTGPLLDELASVPELATAAAALARAGLSHVEIELLLAAAAVELDAAVGRAVAAAGCGADGRPTVELAFRILGLLPGDPDARRLLDPGEALVDLGLVEIGEPHLPFPSRTLACPERVVRHLLADGSPDPRLVRHLRRPALLDEGPAVEAARAVAPFAWFAYVRDRRGGAALAQATEIALAGTGSALVLDLDSVAAAPDPVDLLGAAVREAVLTESCLVAGPVDALHPLDGVVLPVLAEARCPRVLVGRDRWQPRWSARAPVEVEAVALSRGERERLWSRELSALVGPAAPVPPVGLRLDPEQVRRAAARAVTVAAVEGRDLDAQHLLDAAKASREDRLQALTTHIRPAVGWDDLIVPDAVLAQLRDLEGRATHRDLVLDQWKVRRGGGRGRGVTALFAGEPGTGKTMAAEVLAGSLGLDLYVVNLATVVDKYIGETQKNIERLLDEADDLDAVLLFDEADALFGKRSDVKDARDRYANLEVAHLLQRIERFDGLAILTTNLAANLDEAFTRRLDAVVRFPAPDPSLRAELWRSAFEPLPVADGLAVERIGEGHDLCGGHIASIALAAAYRAAASGHPIDAPELDDVVGRELRKLGRLTAADLGR